MNREELLRSPEYWLAHIQSELYAMVEGYMKTHHLKKKDLAEKFGVSKGYITQLLDGDYDHKISKLVDMSLRLNKVPLVTYHDLDDYISKDKLADCFAPVQNQRTIEYKLSVNTAPAINVTQEAFKNISDTLHGEEHFDRQSDVRVGAGNRMRFTSLGL